MSILRYDISTNTAGHRVILDRTADDPAAEILTVPSCSREDQFAGKLVDALNGFEHAPECAGPYSHKIDGPHVYIMAPSPFATDGYIMASVNGGSTESRERTASRVANAFNTARKPVRLAA
jgi:hypothetical protein